MAEKCANTSAPPPSGQLGGRDSIAKGVQKAKKVADIKVSDAEERQMDFAIGRDDARGTNQDRGVVQMIGCRLEQSCPVEGIVDHFGITQDVVVRRFEHPDDRVHLEPGTIVGQGQG